MTLIYVNIFACAFAASAYLYAIYRMFQTPKNPRRTWWLAALGTTASANVWFAGNYLLAAAHHAYPLSALPGNLRPALPLLSLGPALVIIGSVITTAEEQARLRALLLPGDEHAGG